MTESSRRFWAVHDAEWRDAASVVSQWQDAGDVDPALLRFRARGRFWDALDAARATLLVTREYEHLLIALSVVRGRPEVSHLRLPHPSGLAYDPARRVVHVAATRNPNQIFELRPVTGLEPRGDVPAGDSGGHPFIPVASRFFPGSSYLHDLALINGRLHANAVGENAVVRVGSDGQLRRVWWPRCIDSADERPLFDRNYIQLNSIAPAKTLKASFFTASTDVPSSRRPGHRHFAVDGRGVLFSGRTREPVARGLTRPHSARLHRGRVWLANSGYGEVGFAEDGHFRPVTRLDGWTRGLAFAGRVVFAGTSRVIPRFAHYAPGVRLDSSRAGVTALDSTTGRTIGAIDWAAGNQIFALELVPRKVSAGLPFSKRRSGRSEASRRLFYAFRTQRETGGSETR